MAALINLLIFSCFWLNYNSGNFGFKNMEKYRIGRGNLMESFNFFSSLIGGNYVGAAFVLSVTLQIDTRLDIYNCDRHE